MQAMPTQAVLAALVVTFACLWILLSPYGRRLMLDRPNERSLHAQPVPRSGGLAIASGVAAGALFAPAGLGATLGIAAALAAVSFADDIFTLPTLLRLAAHLAAAGAFLTLAGITSDRVLDVVLLLAIAWYANLYNFMDGADGLAGGMAVFGFGAYAWAAQESGQFALAVDGRVSYRPLSSRAGDRGKRP